MKSSTLTSLFKFTAGLAVATCFNLTALATPPNAQIADETSDNTPVASLRQLPPVVQEQLASVVRDKAARTPAQKKISSALIYAARMQAGLDAIPGIRQLETGITPDANGAVRVSIRSRVPAEAAELAKANGAEILGVYPDLKTVNVLMPLNKVEALAADGRVLAVRAMNQIPTLESTKPQPENVKVTQEALYGKLFAAIRGGSVVQGGSDGYTATPPETNATNFPGIRAAVPEGDIRHRSRAARITYGMDGTGLKVGVISDSFNFQGLYAQEAQQGDLPGPGNPNGYTQTIKLAGSGDYLQAGATDEGRAMCQIIHSVLPGAEIYFATAFYSPEDFANNIRALRGIAPSAAPNGNVPNGGCDIIVDDVGYSQEAALRDGSTEGVFSPAGIAIIMQAVNDVVANGGLYFSSAKNSGNKNDNQSGTWEGDFVDGGAATGPLAGFGRAHNWNPGGVADTMNSVTAAGNYIALEWSDPLGQSNNDYDVVTLNAAGDTIVGAGADTQDGDDDPTEAIYNGGGLSAGRQIVVLKGDTAERRFISVDSGRARFEYGTEGQTRGHNCSPGAFGVAATPTTTTVGPSFPAPFGPTNQVETFSSDGPRRVFFDENNFAYNGLSLSTGGGIVRQKPEITAADGSPNTVPGFARFFGTSAAAPHAAAISGLVKQGFQKAGLANPRTSQIRSALQKTATDIEMPGVDRDAGFGVLDAYKAVQATGAPGGAGLDYAVTATEAANSNANGVLDPGETINLSIPLTNVGTATASNVQAELSSTTPGVTVLTSNRSYGNIAPNSTTSPNQPFSFTLSSNFGCTNPADFKLVLNYVGAAAGVAPQTIFFRVTTGKTGFTVSTNLDAAAPPTSTDYTASTGLQTNGRLASGRPRSNCSAKSPNTLNTTNVNGRRYDAYTVVNNGAARCLTITLTVPPGNGNPNADLGNSMNVAAYSTYDPTNPAANHLGDLGGYSTGIGGPATVNFQFVAPANASFTLVVMERNPGIMGDTPTPANAYSLNVAGLAICNTFNGSTQQDVTEVAPVIISNSSFGPATCAANGYTNDININATVKNNSSATLNNVVFQVAILSNSSGTVSSPPYRLLTANGASCTSGGQVGATQTGPVTLAPGASAPVVFKIAAPSSGRYRFGVRTLATTSSAATAKPPLEEAASALALESEAPAFFNSPLLQELLAGNLPAERTASVAGSK